MPDGDGFTAQQGHAPRRPPDRGTDAGPHANQPSDTMPSAVQLPGATPSTSRLATRPITLPAHRETAAPVIQRKARARRIARRAAIATGTGARSLASGAHRTVTSDQARAMARSTAQSGGTIVSSIAVLGGLMLLELSRGLIWTARTFLPIDQPLLRVPSFRAFWLSRLFVQMAQGALLYGLLILVVDRTSSSIYTALFVNCSIVPAIIFGIPGGIVSDSLPRKPMMVGLNAVRFALVAAVVLVQPSLASIFALTLAIWVIHQFYSPIESTVVASLVPPGRLASAQALHNLALTIAQAVGLVLLAPLVLRFFGVDVLFAICASLFFAAAGFCALLPDLAEDRAPATVASGNPTSGPGTKPAATAGQRPLSLEGSLRWFLNGWRMVSRDRIALGAVLDDMMVGLGLSALVVIMPLYLAAVLNTPQENTTFVFAPAALGLVVGLRLAPELSEMIASRFIATAGLVLFAVAVLGIGFARSLTAFLSHSLQVPMQRLGDDLGVSPPILIVMLFSIPAGFASALVGVAARSVLLSRVPVGSRGQVIASQNLFQSLVALVPTLIVGVVAEAVGLQAMAVAIGIVLLVSAGIAHLTFVSERRRPAIAGAGGRGRHSTVA